MMVNVSSPFGGQTRTRVLLALRLLEESYPRELARLLDPGVVHRPTTIEKTANLLYSNLPLMIPPLVFVGMLRLWRARGRDPDLAPLITRYEPPDRLTPAEVGTLIDGKPDLRDITATLVDLAVRGYLHIEETRNETFFGIFSGQAIGSR